MKCLKRKSERRDKRWAPSVDLTHSIHPLFLHHALLVHAFTPPHPSFFCTCLCPCPVCLSVCLAGWMRVSWRESKGLGTEGWERDEAIVKATARHCVHVQPSVPQNWASRALNPNTADGKGLSGCGMEVRQLYAAPLRPVLRAGVSFSAEHS